MHKNAAEAGTLALFVLKKLNDWDHCRILMVAVNRLVTNGLNGRARTRYVCERQTNSAHEPMMTMVDVGNSS